MRRNRTEKPTGPPWLKTIGRKARLACRLSASVLPRMGRNRNKILVIGGSGPGGPASFVANFSRGAARKGFKVTTWDLAASAASVIMSNSWGDWFFPLSRGRNVKTVLRMNGFYSPDWYDNRVEDIDPAVWRLTPELMAVNHRLQRDLAAADHVVYQSAYCKAMADRYLYHRRGDYSVVLNGIDLEHFRPLRKREKAPAMLKIAVAGLIRRGYVVAGAVTCLREIVKQVDARLTFIGPMSRDAEQVLEGELTSHPELQSRVARAGAVSYEDLPRHFAAADLLLHPKPRDPCPHVVCEAMGCGLPVVCASAGGSPEITGDAGIAVEWSQDNLDWIELGKRLAAGVLSASPVIDVLSNRARKRAEQALGLDRMTDGYLKAMGLNGR
jgi:glycosyltransferase involved in cell wall biosynthesis